MMERRHTDRWLFVTLAVGCTALGGCFLGGDYKGGGRTIELPGRDAAGGALSGTTVVIDAGPTPEPPSDASE